MQLFTNSVWLAALTAISCSFSASAQVVDKVIVAPIPRWVTSVAPTSMLEGDGAVDFRLVNLQTRIDADGLHQHFHQVARVLTPEGLAMLGNFGIAWQPMISRARVHMVTIRRNNVVIDVLRDGSAFQVLRREANLEKLQIDGTLTAVLPITDLRLGDEIETSWTLDSSNPVLGRKSENRQFFGLGARFSRFYTRYSWPKERDVNFRVGNVLPKATIIRSTVDTGFVIDKTDYTFPASPEGAPTRFLQNSMLEISEFGDWASVAATMHPLYIEAARTAPASPIRGEVSRIIAMTDDPHARASEALRVVQSQIRYFARIDGLGGYKPETADQVWAGRVGDCKGKTVLLLALLHGLGIEAEAALVSTANGDGLETAMPMPGRFDHVIVRVVIAGKTFWLDGTRLGDRSIQTTAVPLFKWALPINDRQSALVKMIAVDPVLPEDEWRLDLDTRAGIDKIAKATGIAIFRGDKSSGLRALLTAMPVASRETFLRNTWTGRHDWIKIDAVTFSYNEEKAELRLDMTGTGDMEWDETGDTRYNQYEANKSTLGQYLLSKRVEALQGVAPIYVAQRFEVTHQTILLPDGGRGFKLDGVPIDTVIGGVRYTRKASLTGERFDVTSTTKSTEGELSYADAVIADKATDVLFKKRLFIELPVGFKDAVAVSKPKAIPAPVKLTGRAARAELISGSISDDDYPADAIIAGASGITTVSFDIGRDGRVGECGIAASSGSVLLDDKSCALVRERFVYKPARARNGSVTSETRTQRITWRLPEGPTVLMPYDVGLTYDIGIDGVARNCKSTGTTPQPLKTVEQCASVSEGNFARDVTGNPISATVVEIHRRTVTPTIPATVVPSSGSPR